MQKHEKVTVTQQAFGNQCLIGDCLSKLKLAVLEYIDIDVFIYRRAFSQFDLMITTMAFSNSEHAFYILAKLSLPVFYGSLSFF